MKKQFVIGMGALIFANIIWGMLAPIGKELLNFGHISAFNLAALRIIGSAVLFWIISACVAASGKGRLLDIEKKDIFHLFITSWLIIGGNQLLSTLGMNYTYPIDACVCCCITPIFTLILGAIFYYRKFPPVMKIFGVVIGFAGVLVFIFTSTSNAEMQVTNPVLGDVLCLLSQVAGASYLVFYIRFSAKYSALTLMKWLFTFSAVCLLPFTIGDIVAIPWCEMSGLAWFDLIYCIAFGSCLSYMLLPIAQRAVSPTTVAMCNYLQPIIAAIYAIIIGLAVITGESIIASLCILVGVWLVNKQTKVNL